jgi:hypothetical protein
LLALIVAILREVGPPDEGETAVPVLEIGVGTADGEKYTTARLQEYDETQMFV